MSAFGGSDRGKCDVSEHFCNGSLRIQVLSATDSPAAMCCHKLCVSYGFDVRARGWQGRHSRSKLKVSAE